MKRIYIEAIVAGILFFWSLYNWVDKEDSRVPAFDPFGIGAFIQMWIAVATAFVTWLDSL